MPQHPEDLIDSSVQSTEFGEDEACDDAYRIQTVETCEKALEYYNSSKGEKYVMVLPLCSSSFDDRDYNGMFHCNFWAKARDTADDASASLFFAELCIVQRRCRSGFKLLDGKMVEFYELEPMDESEHGPRGELDDLRVLSCVKLEGATVPVYEPDVGVSPIYHPDAAQDDDCDCGKG